MDKATPRPWVMRQALSPVDGAYDYAISSNDVSVLAEAFGRSGTGAFIDAEANAALIVKAVNSHDQLVDALEQCQKALGMLIDAATIENTSSATAWANCVAAEAKARAALKSAKGET